MEVKKSKESIISLCHSHLENRHLHLCIFDTAVVVDINGGEDAARDEGKEGLEDALLVLSKKV